MSDKQAGKLTQLEYDRSDFAVAEKIAAELGYRQTAYTSTSDLIGLFCMKENPEHSTGPHKGGCLIKTTELGWLFVADLNDLNLHAIAEKEARRARRQLADKFRRHREADPHCTCNDCIEHFSKN